MQFMVADYVEGEPGWTDNAAGLEKLLRHAATVGSFEIPAGTYGVNGPVKVYEPGLGDIHLTGNGVELVWTQGEHVTCLEIGTPDRSGGNLSIKGDIAFRLNRACVRSAGVDAILLRGMSGYEIDGISIPSADNMGLTIGRENGADDYIPDHLYIRNCTIGGRTREGPHSHGTIGDTGIWVTTPGLQTRIENNTVKMTGDDAIFVGHNSSGVACDVQIRCNDCEWVAGGIGTSFPNVRITDNTINGTLNAAVRGEPDAELPGIIASGCYAARNTLTRVGFFTAADAGATDAIPQVNPFPLWLRGNNSTSEENYIDITTGTGFRIQAPAGGTLSGLRSVKDTFSRIGCADRSGTLSPYEFRKGAYRRSDDESVVADFQAVGAVVTNTNQSLAEFVSAGVDTNVHIQARLTAVGLGANPLVCVSATGAGRAYITASVDVTDASVIGTPKAVSGGASDAADVSVTIT